MNLQKALFTLNSYQVSNRVEHFLTGLDCRSLLLVTGFYIICILSLPIVKPEMVIWYAVYPIIVTQMTSQNYSTIFIKSLYVLPFLAIIGIFNPWFQQEEVFKIGGIVVTNGWLSFITIILRGLLTTQSLLILIKNSGFIEICNSLRKLGLPKILTVQLYLLYRYIGVILEEAITMHLAAKSRGYGKESLPLKIWTSFAGSLFLRSFERSKRIYQAMLSRGYDGNIQIGPPTHWRFMDTSFCVIWISIFILLYFFDISQFLFKSL